MMRVVAVSFCPQCPKLQTAQFITEASAPNFPHRKLAVYCETAQSPLQSAFNKSTLLSPYGTMPYLAVNTKNPPKQNSNEFPEHPEF